VTTIYVDADACPVKDEIVRVALRHRLPVAMVSNSWMCTDPDPLVEMVVVEQGADVADDWIAERAGQGDIVITRDIPLAARCLGSGSVVLDADGRPFTEAGIGSALAMRELKAHLRETGEIAGYNPSFSKKDRLRLLDAMEREVQKVRRQA
tara:strand:- start:1834 stop:2286 length:453 start_codon:yes stop_codon:yes gene_type:complete